MSCLKLYICKNANFKPLNGCEVRGMQSGAISRRTESRARKVCVNKHEKQKIGQQFGFCHRHDDSFPRSLIWGSILYFCFSWDFSRLKDPIFDVWCLMLSLKSQGPRCPLGLFTSSLVLCLNFWDKSPVKVSKTADSSWSQIWKPLISLGTKSKLSVLRDNTNAHSFVLFQI